jgi:ABC-2 type transport system permease protein
VLGSIFAKTLYDQRRMFMWWSLALVGVSLIYVAGYKEYTEAGILDAELPEYLSALMGVMDYASPEGYLTATFFTLIGSLLMVIFALTIGARAIAGDEETGMLDILLAHPISRTRLVLERFAALVAATAGFGLIAWLAVTVAARIAEMAIPVSHIAAACAGLALAGLVIGSVALAVGALTGRLSLAIGVTVGVALVSFLANNLAPMIDGLASLQRLSPFYYYLGGDPLRAGFDASGSAVLAVAALLLAGLAVWGLNRRDVGV